jgi:hypothetical protein
MAQFHETMYGRKFLESDFPRLVKAMERIAERLEELTEKPEKDESDKEAPDTQR